MNPGAPSNTPQSSLHPRNRHGGRYDFAMLTACCPELAAHVAANAFGDDSIDFADPLALRALNRALLRHFYGVGTWDIPARYLCPPIPGRADHLHYLADLLAASDGGEIPRGTDVRVLDIGTGANLVYPLIGHAEYRWRFVGSDIDAGALAAANATVQANRLSAAIELRQQHNRGQIFAGLLADDEHFELTLCNPPFHASACEAASGSRRKWKNLGKLDPKRKLPELNFGGQSSELWCTGGEASFVKRMIKESSAHAQQVLWFSSLISKVGNLPDIYKQLNKLGAKQVRTVEMTQGNKLSRFVAWSFLDPAEQQAWRQQRWANLG